MVRACCNGILTLFFVSLLDALSFLSGKKLFHKLSGGKHQRVLFEQWLVVPQITGDQGVCIRGNEDLCEHDIVWVCVALSGDWIRGHEFSSQFHVVNDSQHPRRRDMQFRSRQNFLVFSQDAIIAGYLNIVIQDQIKNFRRPALLAQQTADQHICVQYDG